MSSARRSESRRTARLFYSAAGNGFYAQDVTIDAKHHLHCFWLAQLMWSIFVLLFLFGISQVNGQVASSGSAPVVINEKFYPSTPASIGGTVGTVSATNPPTSWSITAGNSAGEFAISNSGVITFTSREAA